MCTDLCKKESCQLVRADRYLQVNREPDAKRNSEKGDLCPLRSAVVDVGFRLDSGSGLLDACNAEYLEESTKHPVDLNENRLNVSTS